LLCAHLSHEDVLLCPPSGYRAVARAGYSSLLYCRFCCRRIGSVPKKACLDISSE
jgi:hypothetical protein